VLKRYGQEVKLFKLGRMPAQVIVDKQGQARYVHYGHSMSDIPPNDELLAILERLRVEITYRDTAWPLKSSRTARAIYPSRS
jgi:peroxiredoxin Q/BCP